MHWAHPAMARRWDREEHKLGLLPPSLPLNFPELRGRGLVGISDRTIAQHIDLYHKAHAELCSVEAELLRAPWSPPLDVPSNDIQALLDSPVSSVLQPFDADGSVMQPDGKLAACLSQLKDELLAKGISWFPAFYFGEADFWTADRAVSINLPWYLATDILWSLVNDQTARYSSEDLMRVLRHETGHALGYAFELWKRDEWRAAFGDFEQPYQDSFAIDVARATEFVTNLSDSVTAPNAHYAQKHPDEDWAETFAVWLDPGSRWRDAYGNAPAIHKLEAVELMIVGKGAAYGEPPNKAIGDRVPASTISYTVGEFLGVDEQGPDVRAALARRAPALLGSVALHESYFEVLRRGAGTFMDPGQRFQDAATMSFGSYAAWLSDARAILAATDGWLVTSWSPRDRRLRNNLVEGHDKGLPPGATILLALDAHEHSYFGDYGSRKDLYVGALFRNVDWVMVSARFDAASPPPPPELTAPPLPVPVLLAEVTAEPEVPEPPKVDGSNAEEWAIPGQEGP